MFIGHVFETDINLLTTYVEKKKIRIIFAANIKLYANISRVKCWFGHNKNGRFILEIKWLCSLSLDINNLEDFKSEWNKKIDFHMLYSQQEKIKK